ncbi:MAG: LPS export ABC transporter periplasmic protein LptC, partial [Sediminibacterium sp.]
DVNEVRELGRKRQNIEEGKDIQSYLSMNGKMRAHLTAPLLLRYQDSGNMAEFPKSLHVDFYNDSAKIESQLRALFGRYRESENKVYLRDDVVVFNTKGDTLFCEDLYWDQTTQKFYTDRKVTYSRNYRRTVITGNHGMLASQDLSNVILYKIDPNSFYYVPDSTQSTTTTTTAPPPAPAVDTIKKNKPKLIPN